MILFSDPKAGYDLYSTEIKEAIHEVLNSGFYIKGKSLATFEKNFALYLNSKHSIGVANGTDAVYLALKALGIEEGDEVITVSHTATGTASGIIQTKASPVFVDIDPVSMNIDTTKIEEKINSKTKALIAVHLYGQACDMEAIMNIAEKYNLAVVEDCAQAAGASYKGQKVGTIGNVGCFSFFPTKNLSGYGDGGAISTDDDDIAKTVLAMREYGWDSSRDAYVFGINSRLDEIQASILNVKLSHLDEDNNDRIRAAEFYMNTINNPEVTLPKNIKHSHHVYHLFVLRIASGREDFINYLKQNEIIAGIHYALPVHKQTYYKKFADSQSLEITEKVASDVVSIPIYQGIKQEDLDKVAKTINNYKV